MKFAKCSVCMESINVNWYYDHMDSHKERAYLEDGEMIDWNNQTVEPYEMRQLMNEEEYFEGKIEI